MQNTLFVLILGLSFSLASSTPIKEFHSAIADVDFLSPSVKDFGSSNAARPYSLQVERKIVRSGESSLRFEIRQGDAWARNGGSGHGTHRVEVQENDHAEFEKDYWYEFSMWMPDSFVDRDQRLIIGQWHGEADTHLGEHGRNPPVVQRYRDGDFYVQVRWHEKEMQIGPDAVDNSKRKEIFLEKGFPRNTWVDFVYHIKWSWRGNGVVRIYRRIVGQDSAFRIIADYKGPVGYNDRLGPYFKMGLYRDDNPFVDIMYWDNFRRVTDPQNLRYSEAIPR